MGVDYSAYAFIGCELPRDRMYRSVRVRLSPCSHKPPEDAEFCPKCGTPLWRVGKEPIPEWDEGDGTLAGLVVVSGTDRDRLFACTGAATVRGYNHDGAHRISVERWDAIRETLREVLEPLGLWDERSFGLWSVLHCSY